ncbi:MAG: hypothetical protein ACK419_05915, partial [Pyrinomonadaceae bacterium]
MWREVLIVVSVMLLVIPVSADQNFTISAEEFGAAMVSNTIANLKLGQAFLKALALANASSDVSSDGYMFQNMWGVIYGGIVLSGWNNKITALVLDNLTQDNTNLTKLGLAINYLGRNASVVFGDADGTQGLALLIKGQYNALKNSSRTYEGDTPLLKAYINAIADQIYSTTLFLIELGKS